ncbi:MAG: flavodoxin domain-containing protein [Candidatus Peregrinibacteria bacterium]|nr:flavodoxin domain-containing protein [Candidatus Peregrinibacteria bacterium]MDZ4244977.1 flavodoxin domain-containing protein [Candidatus Gracilibacteria bacterium]
MASVSIIYGSTGGNTEMVAEAVQCALEDGGCKVGLMRVERYSIEELFSAIENSDLFIIAAPTYGHGEMQEDLKPFLHELKSYDLKGKKCAVIGLGEAKYDAHYHIAAVPIIEEIIKDANGEFIFRPLRISGSPVANLDRLIPLWTKGLIEEISKI